MRTQPTEQAGLFEQTDDGPLVLSYGVGVDSTAVLVGWHALGIRPDLIMFADPGAEHRRTYRYLDLMERWLAQVGFPPVVTVTYRPRNGRYETIAEECLLKMVLPSLAYGKKSCSQKWKVAPQQRYLSTWKPAREAWSRGARIRNAIGYDAGPKDKLRGKENVDTPLTKFTYPLRDWGWDRTRCEAEIAGCESLAAMAAEMDIPVSPDHSSCVFCPSMRPEEVLAMEADEPENLALALAVEAMARPHLTALDGLWRQTTETRDGSWLDFAGRHMPDARPASPALAHKALAPLETELAAPPPGTKYAIQTEAGIRYHDGLREALAEAGRGPLLAWMDSRWFRSVEARR